MVLLRLSLRSLKHPSSYCVVAHTKPTTPTAVAPDSFLDMSSSSSPFSHLGSINLGNNSSSNRDRRRDRSSSRPHSSSLSSRPSSSSSSDPARLPLCNPDHRHLLLMVVGEDMEALHPFEEEGDKIGYLSSAMTNISEATKLVANLPRPVDILVMVLSRNKGEGGREDADEDGEEESARQWQGVARAAKCRSEQTFVAVIGRKLASSAPFRAQIFLPAGREEKGKKRKRDGGREGSSGDTDEEEEEERKRISDSSSSGSSSSIGVRKEGRYRRLDGGLAANMATASQKDVFEVLQQIMDICCPSFPSSTTSTSRRRRRNSSNSSSSRTYTCPSCGMTGLSEDGLHAHFPLYHVCQANAAVVTCPICRVRCDVNSSNSGSSSSSSRGGGGPFPPHLQNMHGPHGRDGRGSLDEMVGPALYAYALVVVRQREEDGGKFLMVQEFGASGWWLPGGRVDPGEDFATAARRECEEEAGIKIELTGILRIEFMPSRPLRRREGSAGCCRMRVIYLGKPVDGQQLPKGKSDFESVGAAWATCEEVEKVLRLRGSEPRVWVPYVARAQGPLHPLSLLTMEGKLP